MMIFGELKAQSVRQMLFVCMDSPYAPVVMLPGNGNSIAYGDVTAWFLEMVNEYEITPAWIYYDSYSAKYWVEEMENQGFRMVRCIQGARTLSLPMQMMGSDLQAEKINYNNWSGIICYTTWAFLHYSFLLSGS